MTFLLFVLAVSMFPQISLVGSLFLFALLLSTNHHARTIPVGIALFQGLHGETPRGTVMAAATLSIVPVVFLTLFFQRRIVEGLTRGAVKG